MAHYPSGVPPVEGASYVSRVSRSQVHQVHQDEQWSSEDRERFEVAPLPVYYPGNK